MFEPFLMLVFTLILLLIAISIIYNTVKLGISPMPSSNKAYIAMMQLADETGSDPIIDLGSGWGNFVIRIARKYPHREVVGYELSYLPWLISTLLKKAYGLKNLTLYKQNFYQADLSDASVLVCYLFPEAMIKISNKLQGEKSGIRFLISNNFALPKSQPFKVIQLKDFYKSPIYLYKLGNNSSLSIEE
jgi:hypothetical protein